MADDVWGAFGAGSGGRQKEWLYRLNGRMYGPFAGSALIDKIRTGALPGNVYVAEDGSDDFRTIDQFDAFKDEVPKALAQFELKRQRDAQKRRAQLKQRMVMIGVLLVALIAAGGIYAGTQWYRAEQQRKAIALAERQRKDAEDEAKRLADRKEAEARAKAEEDKKKNEKTPVAAAEPEIDLDMIPLVSVKKKVSKPTVPGQKKPPDEETQGCQLDQGELVGSFHGAFPALKACIKDQQRRGGDLPETVNLSFTIANTGSVSSFDMDENGIKSGPFFDCLKKAVMSVHYKKFPGERCNVDYPISIGKKK